MVSKVEYTNYHVRRPSLRIAKARSDQITAKLYLGTVQRLADLLLPRGPHATKRKGTLHWLSTTHTFLSVRQNLTLYRIRIQREKHKRSTEVHSLYYSSWARIANAFSKSWRFGVQKAANCVSALTVVQ